MYRFAGVAMTVVACALVTGCAQDTPKSVFQNSEEYANRVFVPSMLSSSVLAKATDGKPMPFSKITFSQSAKIMFQGAPVDVSHNVTYENAGNSLVRQIQVGYMNGVVSDQYFALTYRGMLPLRELYIKPNSVRMPYKGGMDSFSQFDVSFDQPSLNYVYRWNSSVPPFKTVDRRGACTLASSYVGSKLAAGIAGEVREFDCKHYNDNGVQDTDSHIAYLEAYGVALVKSEAKTSFTVDWTISNFKVE
jgi:hypothetical protein